MREQHSHDESYHRGPWPDIVLFPESTDDVVRILQTAFAHRIPVVPFGAGTALEGHVVPVKRGISLDMTRMNRILDIRPDDFLVCVEPGTTRLALNDALRRHGLFFPVDPGANATIGGMTATNASGTNAVRYGAMRENVRALEVVLADGRVIRTGSLAAKTSSGYNLNSLFVGSEGTLGVFTRIWLRVFGIPERIVAARAEFPDIPACVQAATALVGAGVPVARIELVDARFIAAFNRFKGTDYPVVPTLFLEFHGSSDGILHDIRLAQALLGDEGCTRFVAVTDEKERTTLWEARHSAAHVFMAQYPGLKHMATDVCVPLSVLPAAVAHAHRALEEHGMRGAIIGHVGDGNFHCSIALDPDDPDDLARAKAVNAEIVAFALAHGGTCTGEHGVGIGKRAYQAQEHGPALEVMRAIRRLLDPHGILNPGKLVDPDE
ncbi:FAD-binding oxidoreductase [Alicyclobacillus cellulosilyticus]|uniref:FAD-binding oxidoreductase n=1 Tax=Alicyclobacillus cellulosilyticus TaxID=1003997 RepID=UPI0027E59AF9|nr:FAD-linked oxidase C-terminal domain-containing protein [Alicyclobacillus cellulosilyticus]